MPPARLERRPQARILSRKLSQRVETRDGLSDVSKQHEECVGIAGVLSRQLLGVFHLLEKESSSQVSTVWEISIQRRLPDLRAPRDLVHRNIGTVGEQLPRRSQDCLSVALGVLAPQCLIGSRHTGQCSAEDSVRKRKQ